MPGKKKKMLCIGSLWAVLLLSVGLTRAAEGNPPPKDRQGSSFRRAARRSASPDRRGVRADFGLVGTSDEQGPRFGRGDRRTRGPAPRGDRVGRRRTLSPEEFAEEFDEIQRFLEDHFPERLGELRRFRRTNPDAFRRHMGQMIPRLRRIMDMLERNPEAGRLMLREERLGFQIHQLVDRYFEANDPDLVRHLRREIRGLVEEQFDVRLELREQEVRRLERRLEAIRTRLARDRERREQRIEQDLGDLGIFED